MTTALGSAFTPTPTVQPDPDRQADQALLDAVERLTETVAELELPAPNITLPEPRVTVELPLLPEPPSASEIGRAVAEALPHPDDERLVSALLDVRQAVKDLAKTTRAPRFGTGGGLAGAAFDSAGNLKVVTAGGSSAGLTNTELRATPVPVSGTVSTGLSQPLTDAQLRASAVPVAGTVTANTGLAQPLTDTQLRASALPVSGPLTDTQLRATPVPVSGTVTANTGLTQPLTDTQLRASAVPVSGTVTDNQGTPNSVANAWPVKNTDGTNTAAVKAASTAAVVADAALVVSLSPNSPAPLPTLTKGTQGATGISSQDLKDAGRSSKAMVAAFTSTAATETAISFQVSSAGGALAAAATSYTVTAGKTLRIQAILAQMRAGGTTPAASLATLKIKIGGNQQGQAFMVAAPTTVAAGPAAFVGMLSGLNFPDGFEVAAGGVLSFTLTLSAWTAAVNTPVIDLTVVGYEY